MVSLKTYPSSLLRNKHQQRAVNNLSFSLYLSVKRNGEAGDSSAGRTLLLFQTLQVQFPAPTLGSLQPICHSRLKELDTSSGLRVRAHTRHILTQLEAFLLYYRQIFWVTIHRNHNSDPWPPCSTSCRSLSYLDALLSPS